MAAKTLQDLLVSQIQDAYSAETQLVKALPKMAKAATSSELKAGFSTHLKETEGHVRRLEEVCAQIGCKTGGVTCEAMEGLVAEGEEMIDFGTDGEIRDVGLIIAAQKVEHYEIALYGGICAVAKQLGKNEIATTLSQTLEEEKRTDQKLTQLAEAAVNKKAATK